MTYPRSATFSAFLEELDELRREGERRPRIRYNVFDGVASNQSKTDNMRAARLGATPLGRAARHSGVDE